MAQLQKYKDDFFLFLEGGFIAASQTDEDAALKLFRTAELMRPDNKLIKVGYGYIHLLKLELQQAIKTFEEVLKTDPTNDMARAMLGLSTALTGKETDKGEKILHEAAERTQDSTVKNMANTAIEFVEFFVKKQPGPLQAPQPKKKKKGKNG